MCGMHTVLNVVLPGPNRLDVLSTILGFGGEGFGNVKPFFSFL